MRKTQYSMRNTRYLSAAFTYVEMVITIVVIAICFVPLIQMFSGSIGEVVYAGDKLTALNLAREEMEKFRNLNLTESQLLSLGNMITPAKSEPPLKRNKVNWRIERVLKENSDPLEVNIIVWRESKTPQKILEVATLIEDLEWTEED